MKLGKLCEIVRGSSPRPKGDSRFYGGNIPRLMIADVTRDGKYVTPKIDFLTEKGASLSRPMKKGDLIIAVSGNPGLPTILQVDACIHDGFVGLKNLDTDRIYVDYLYWFLNLFQNQIKNRAVGAIFKNLTTHQIFDIEIPLPPIAEQKRIADILDKADAIRRKRQEAIKLTEEFARSLFLDMFGDPVTNSKGWEVKTIEDLVKNEKEAIKRGPFGGDLKKDIFVKKGYLVYEQYHALNNDFSFERYYIDENKFEEMKGFEVKPGDIIISCSGVYLGKLAIIPEGAKKGIINQALLKITLDQTKMKSSFFKFHFSQKSFKDKFFRSNRGSGVPNFPPMNEFKTFPFIVPPIDKQNQFQALLEKNQDYKEKINKSLAESENFFNSLLQKAFKGEL